MAVTVLTNCGVYVGALDLTCQSNEVAANVEVAELDGTTFCDGGYTASYPGLRSGTFDFSGFMSYATDIDGTLLTAASTSNNVTTVSLDTTAGSLAWHGNGMNATFSPIAGSVGELATLTGSIKSSSGRGVREGYLLAAKATTTSTASTTGVQMFTSGTITTLTAALHVFAASGTTPSMTVTVASSSTQGGSYTTRGTFTAATGVTAEHITVTGLSVTDQWWRVTRTISGTSPSFSSAVSAAVS